MTRIGTAVAVAVIGLLLAWRLWPAGLTATTLTVGSADRIVTVTVTARVGDRDVDIRLTDRSGRPADGPVEVSAVLSTMGYATPPIPAVASGGGRFRAARIPLVSAGEWQLRVDAGGTTHVLPLTVLP